MTLPHVNVTATVSITGLALGCYNQTTQNYEVGLLRHDTHNLTIEVTKWVADDDASVMKFILDKQHRIFIDAENAIVPDSPIYMDGEDFDRQDITHDQEDYRWVIDFETDLNNGEPVELKHPEVPVTEMYVSKPTLYADPLLISVDTFKLVPLDAQGQPLADEVQDFGFFTEGIKADIHCQNGGAVILRIDGPQGFQIHLPHGSAKPHEIKVENICLPKAQAAIGNEEPADPNVLPEPTDFRLFYSVITDTDGKKFDLQPSSVLEEGEGAVCNGGSLGKRDSLFPLP